MKNPNQRPKADQNPQTVRGEEILLLTQQRNEWMLEDAQSNHKDWEKEKAPFLSEMQFMEGISHSAVKFVNMK